METLQELTEQYCEECQNKLDVISALEDRVKNLEAENLRLNKALEGNVQDALDEATAAAWDAARAEYEPKIRDLQEMIYAVEIERNTLQTDVHVLRMERDNEESENQALKMRTLEAEDRARQCMIDTESECVRRLNMQDDYLAQINKLREQLAQAHEMSKLDARRADEVEGDFDRLWDDFVALRGRLGVRIHLLREIARIWQARTYTTTVLETSHMRMRKKMERAEKALWDIEAIASIGHNMEPDSKGYEDILRVIVSRS